MRCAFILPYGFEFHYQKERVSVLFCMSCLEVKFYYQGKDWVEDFDSEKGFFTGFFKNILDD